MDITVAEEFNKRCWIGGFKVAKYGDCENCYMERSPNTPSRNEA